MALFIPKDRKSLFRQFLAGMYDAVVITDPNGYILEINPRAVEYFGREMEDVLDKPIALFIPGLKQEIVTRIRKGLEGDRHVVIDANGVDVKGVKIACEVAVSPIDLMNPGDLVFTIRNVERRRAYMNAFRMKANAFRMAPVALFGCEAGGRLVECNEAFLALAGVKDVETARQHVLTDFVRGEAVAEALKGALAGEASVTCPAADGAGQALEVVLAPNLNGRKVQGVVGSVRRV